MINFVHKIYEKIKSRTLLEYFFWKTGLLKFKKSSLNHFLKVVYNGKFFNNGMGLHRVQINLLKKLITNDINNIVEFGSGQSTKFLLTHRQKRKLNYNLISFDHNPEYAYNSAEKIYDFSLHIRPLVQYSKNEFNTMFFNRKLSENFKIVDKKNINNFRIKNTFYKINESDLPDIIDFVILDGPNGNGRSVAFLHLYKKLKKNSIILIDDVDHYDFLLKLGLLYNYEVIKYSNNPKIHPLFSFAAVRILSIKE